ncbi:hypothetical protein Vadar_011638 [Vaccinium darrowii]|uniref:Uncharacterized protein n=1 Tax=Vaccinium darrowii TaxID=229202 RepID=A0ACB7X8V8_9ERIC|nr:hypothetical protein Vadar_011638 [Vaccinium darrowii]
MHLCHVVYLDGKVATGYVEKQQMQLQDAAVLCVVIVAVVLEIQINLHHEVDNAAKDLSAIGEESQDYLREQCPLLERTTYVIPSETCTLSLSSLSSSGAYLRSCMSKLRSF